MAAETNDPSTWRLQTSGGVPYKIESRSGEFAPEGARAQEVYRIQANQLNTFVLESFPLPYVFLNTIFYPITRRLPGYAVFQTAKISWEGWTDGRPVDPFSFDPTAPTNTYEEFLKLTVDYETGTFNGGANEEEPNPNDPFTFLEVSAVSTGSFVYTPARGSLQWEGYDTEPDVAIKDRDVPLTVPEPKTEWTLKWSRIPFEFFNGTLMARMRGKIGKVNNAVMPIFFDAPAETILFLGYTVREQFTWRTGLVGKPPIEVELKFLEKNFESNEGVQVTHNHFYRPSGSEAIPGGAARTVPGWRKVLINTTAGQKNVFDDTDLNAIFSPEEGT